MRQLALSLCLALCLSTPVLHVYAQAASTSTVANATAAVVKAAGALGKVAWVDTSICVQQYPVVHRVGKCWLDRLSVYTDSHESGYCAEWRNCLHWFCAPCYS